MADMVLQHDIVDLTAAAAASAHTSVTAGGAGDAAAVSGLTIDRYLYGLGTTASFDLMFQATLAAAATLSITAVKVEDSSDGSNWATYQPGPRAVVTAPGVIATGPTGGGTLQGVIRFGVGLREARRYVRFDFTPDLSAATTDTASIMVQALIAGFDRLPYVPGSPD